MTKKSQHNNILLAILGFAITVIVVGVIGFVAFGKTPRLYRVKLRFLNTEYPARFRDAYLNSESRKATT